MVEPIIFYDVPGNKNPARAWSPNTLKTRYTLLYKGLPFKTVWVEFPDIAAVIQEIVAKPTSVNADGSPLYTLPAIYDPSTKTGLADSFEIARYLDKQYPNTPTVIPAGTEALQVIFDKWFIHNMIPAFGPLFVITTSEQLNPQSKEWYLRKFATILGTAPGVPAEKRPEVLARAKKRFDELGVTLDKNGPGAASIVSDTPSLADFLVAGFMFSLRLGLLADEWEQVAGWHDGRWAKYLERWPLPQSENEEDKFYET